MYHSTLHKPLKTDSAHRSACRSAGGERRWVGQQLFCSAATAMSVLFAVLVLNTAVGTGYAAAQQQEVAETVFANGSLSADISMPPADTKIVVDSTGTEMIAYTHTVQPGDNLFRLSLQYGISVNRLKELNKLVSTDFIKVGQPLIISEFKPYTTSTNLSYDIFAAEHQNYMLHLYEQNIDQTVYNVLDRFMDTRRLFVDTRISARLISNFELAISELEAAGSGEETSLPAIASVPSYLYRDGAGPNRGAHMVIGTEAGQQLDIDRIAVYVFMDEEPEEDLHQFLEQLIFSAARLNKERGDFVNFEFIRFPAAAETDVYNTNRNNNEQDTASAFVETQNGESSELSGARPGIIAAFVALFLILIWFLFRASGNKSRTVERK